MTATAFVFPGQGSQRAGMGLDFLQRRPDLLHTYYRGADEVLGFKFSETCWNASAETLRKTSVTQPAVFLTSIVILDVLRAHDVEPGVVAGHSLGEYAALVAAGVLEWTDALQLVQLRGELMEAVATQVPGTMAAVFGLDLAQVQTVCADAAAASGQVVEVANDNEPGQIVVSGHAAAVLLAAKLAAKAGARRVLPLKVGAPFHSSLMGGAGAEFAQALAGVDFRAPVVPLVSSVTAAPVTGAEHALSILHRQLTAPVRWTETVTRMSGQGADRFIEVGPGRVLAGLCRRIAPDSRTHTTGTVGELGQTVDAVMAAPAAVAG